MKPSIFRLSQILNSKIPCYPLYFSDFYATNFTIPNYTFGCNYLSPRLRTKMYGDRVFLVAGLQLWNELPLDIRTISDVNAFKRSLKTFLFRQAYFEYL